MYQLDHDIGDSLWIALSVTAAASESLKPPTDHFAAWYGELPATARRPPIDDTWKMCPLFCLRMSGSAARVV